MERKLITTSLLICLTLGFLALFVVYLPSKVSKQTRPIAEPKPIPIPTPVSEEKIEEELEMFRKEVAKMSGETAIKKESEETVVEEESEFATDLPTEPKVSLNEEEEAQKYQLLVYQPLPKASLYISGFRFHTPYAIRDMMEFWRNVFARYENHQSVFHDPNHMEVVFGVLDYSDLYENPLIDEEERYRVRRYIDEKRKEEMRETLLAFHQGHYPTSEYERYIYNLYEHIRDPHKFREAAGGIRAQWGQKDRFEAGLIRFERYREKLEQLFRYEGVPSEITRLTFVESMFNIDAVSKVGAAGPWQFMPGTAKEFMAVNEYVDERRDPLIAGWSAAKLLKKNYEHVRSWPMAINGYNTGIGRLIKAKNKLKTGNIATIIQHYDGPGYQFASRNFYPEFLAALEVANNYQRYFGDLPLDEPVPFDEMTVPNHTSLYELARLTGTDLDVLKDLNPSFREKLFSKYGIVPEGITLRVPHRQSEIFLATIDLIREKEKDVQWHVVGQRESLHGIARKYNVALNYIQKINGLTSTKVKQGTILKIPSTE